MAELLITSSIDPIKEGQVFEHGLPRHVTIWQDFTLPDLHMNEFIADAGNAIEGFSPLEIVAFSGKPDKFGPHHDVPVRRVYALGAGATLYALHAVLGSVIKQYEGEAKNPEWAYRGYNPHVTYVDGRALDEGERELLTTVELIQRDSHMKSRKIVRKLWPLEEA